jgi:hypothetical protein
MRLIDVPWFAIGAAQNATLTNTIGAISFVLNMHRKKFKFYERCNEINGKTSFFMKICVRHT